MIVHKIDCWEVYESYDRDSTTVAYCSTKSLAIQMKGTSPYRGYRKFDKTIIVLESMDDAEKLKRQKLIESAKSKLSKEELEELVKHYQN